MAREPQFPQEPVERAVRMLEDGFATREDIDTAVHLGLNHPMGPLQLIDLIGLDTHLFIANVLFEEFKEPTFAPPPLLRRMVTAGRLGRKVGHGPSCPCVQSATATCW